MRTVFIVGSGRSGTSLVWRLFNSDPQVRLAPETHFLDQWLVKYPDPVELWSNYRHSRHFASIDIDVEPPLESPRALFEALLDARAGGASVRGEKTAAHFRYIDRLLDWFPDAEIVFVVREARAVVGSLVAHDEAWASGSVIEHIRLWNAAAAQALRWREHPNVHVVRYEDLAADPLQVLGALWPSVVGHAFDPGWLPSGEADRYASGSLRGGKIASDRGEVWRERLTARQQRLVLQGCASLMAQLGYETSGHKASALELSVGFLFEDARRAVRALGSPGAFLRRLAYRRRGTRRADS